jgi:hypothetical protein
MLSKLLSELTSAITPAPANPPPHPIANPSTPIQSKYHSVPIPIPPTFLTTPAADSVPITATRLDFSKTTIPEYAPLYAVVLDHVLSPSECATLLRLAEASVPAPGEEGGELRNGETDPWGPALVNVGGGYEVLEPGYRRSDRIVWDQQEVVDRIWERCLGADGVGEGGEGFRERFAGVGGDERDVVGMWQDGRWEFLRVNERMRFLRYGKGGFFQRESFRFSEYPLLPLCSS